MLLPPSSLWMANSKTLFSSNLTKKKLQITLAQMTCCQIDDKQVTTSKTNQKKKPKENQCYLLWTTILKKKKNKKHRTLFSINQQMSN